MEGGMTRTRMMLAMFVLPVVVSACASWEESESDVIRRAVITHEVDVRGVQVDELIIRLSPGEFRADLGDESRIVWLVSPGYQRQYREGEFFKVRDPGRSYLFVQDITYGDSRRQAAVRIVLYLGSGQLTTKEIALHKEGNSWQVSSEQVLETARGEQ